MSKAQLTAFLYKSKLNQKTIIDLLDSFSSTTIKSIIKDLTPSIKTENFDNLYIYSDGGCVFNGKKNAKAGYSVYCKEFEIFNKTREITSNPSNNCAELSGIRHIFKILFENQNLFNKKEIFIVTDSKYSIDCVSKWSDNWIKNGWVNSKKEPVKNKELIQEILEYKNKIELNVEFKHIFSHTVEPSNKESLEHTLWYGNKICDDNITKLLKNNPE
jgi:ribonuclease HI